MSGGIQPYMYLCIGASMLTSRKEGRHAGIALNVAVVPKSIQTFVCNCCEDDGGGTFVDPNYSERERNKIYT